MAASKTPQLLLLKDAGEDLAVEWAVAGGIPRINAQPWLHQAVKFEKTRTIRVLLASGWPVDAINDQAETALHWAALLGRDQITGWLIEAGAAIDARTATGEIPLHRATRNAHPSVVTRLLNAGSQVNAVNQYGETAVFLAASLHDKEQSSRLLSLLLCADADPNQVDFQRRTALMMAIEKGHCESVRLLLEAGADPNAIDRWGRHNEDFAPAWPPEVKKAILSLLEQQRLAQYAVDSLDDEEGLRL